MSGRGILNAAFDDLRNMLCDMPTREKIVTHGLMESKFLITESGVSLLSVSRDVYGVTGYTPEEIKGKDIMRLLGLNKSQVLSIVTRTEATGFCLKETKFTHKSGKVINVTSLMIKTGDNQYTEYTMLSNQKIVL